MATSERDLFWPLVLVAPAGLVGWWLFRQPGKFFTWEELTTTGTGLPNVPTLTDRIRLIIATRRMLDPIRDVVGPVSVMSGFRSPAVNEEVGGAGGACHGGPGCSQHTVGYGFDIIAANYSNDEVAEMLYEGAMGDLPIYQVITYQDTDHLHLGYDPGGLGATQYLEHQLDGSYPDWTP